MYSKSSKETQMQEAGDIPDLLISYLSFEVFYLTSDQKIDRNFQILRRIQSMHACVGYFSWKLNKAFEMNLIFIQKLDIGK